MIPRDSLLCFHAYWYCHDSSLVCSNSLRLFHNRLPDVLALTIFMPPLLLCSPSRRCRRCDGDVSIGSAHPNLLISACVHLWFLRWPPLVVKRGFFWMKSDCYTYPGENGLHIMFSFSFGFRPFLSINFWIYFTFWLQLPLPPLLPLYSHLLSTPTPILLCFHSERDRFPMSGQQARYIKLRQDQVLPPASRMDRVIQHGD